MSNRCNVTKPTPYSNSTHFSDHFAYHIIFSFVITWRSGSCQAHQITTTLLGTWPRATSHDSQPHHVTVSLTSLFTFNLVFSLHDTLSASPLCWLSYSMCALLYTTLFSTSWLQSVSICSFLTLVPYSTLPYSLLLFTLVILFITNIMAVVLSSVDLYFIYIKYDQCGHQSPLCLSFPKTTCNLRPLLITHLTL